MTLHGANDAPAVTGSLSAQSWSGGGAASYTLPSGTFVDPDRGDVITLHATLADGSPLPSWLGFDPATGTFSGTPAPGSHGQLDIVVTARDSSGASGSTGLALRFDAPTPPPPPRDPVPSGGSGGGRSIVDPGPAPLVTIVGPDPSRPTTPGVTGGSNGAQTNSNSSVPLLVPNDPSRGGGSPPSASFTPADHGSFSVPVAPTIATGAAATLVVFHPIADTAVGTGTSSILQVPSDSFMHTDPTARVALSAIREDGSSLPTWVSFDPQTGRFDVRPPTGFSGEIVIRVIARDQSGHEATQTFKLDVGHQRQGALELPGGDPIVPEVVGRDGSERGLVPVRPVGRLALSRQFEMMSAARSASHRALAASVGRHMRLS